MSQNYFYKPYLSDADSSDAESSGAESSDAESSDAESSGTEGSFTLLSTNRQGVGPREGGLGAVGPLTSVSGLPAVLQSHGPARALPPIPDPKIPAFETTETRVTTLFMVNSRDRDLRAYPQPTLFTLRLPRPFKNISAITLTQINLLNTFFNFTAAQGNTNMYVLESGRVTTSNTPNAVNVVIPDGTYTTDTLVPALSNALNSTPLFAQITLPAFITYFQSSGNYSVLFNVPGAVVYNSLTQTYATNQTVSDIVARYFQTSQTAGQLSFSYNECVVAYYYPIIKEMTIAAPTSFSFSTEGLSIPTGYTTWYDYLVFGFQGLDDPTVTAIATDPANQVLFDAYRVQHSFVDALVNAYTVNYNSITGRLIIAAPSLNASIASNLTYQYSLYLSNLVLSNGFPDIGTFQSEYQSNINSNAALISMYNFLQSRFTSNFAVNFGQYAASFYANQSNQIALLDPINRYGWTTTLTPAVSASTITTTANAAPQYSNWWPPLATIPQSNVVMGAVGQDDFLSAVPVPQFTGPQNQDLFFEGAGEHNFGYTDVPFTVSSTRYVRIPFSSRCRQNISLMTIPRYLNDRGPSTDERYALGASTLQTPLLVTYNSTFTTIMGHTTSTFTTYDLLDISGNLLFNMYTVNQSMFNSADYMRTYDGTTYEWARSIAAQVLAGTRVQDSQQLTLHNVGPAPPIPALGSIAVTSYTPYFYFQLNGDGYLSEQRAHFQINIYVETQDGSAFPVPLILTWYKDRAGFMADTRVQLAGSLQFAEARHYFQQQEILAGTTSAIMTVDINNYQQTYMSIRIDATGPIPAAIPLRIFAVLKNAYGVYTIATPLDRLDMPYADLPPLDDQYTPNSAVFQNPTKSVYDPAVFQLAYDVSGVSNNLLDYTIQAGSNYYDPASIETYSTTTYTGLRYQFGYATGGAGQPPPTVSNWSLYFGSNASNVIRDTYSVSGNVYLSSLQVPSQAVTSNQFLLTNFAVPYSQPEYTQLVYPGVSIYKFNGPTITFQICRVGDTPTPLPPILATDVQIAGTDYDQVGVCGTSFFLPPNQIVQLNSLTFKFAYTQASVINNSTITRTLPDPGLLQHADGAYYYNQTNRVATNQSQENEWDDWFLLNRKNTKIGVFHTNDISGVNLASLQLSNALYTLTLSKVTQVNKYQFLSNTPRTREPDWGTFYTYTKSNEDTLWDVTDSSNPFVFPPASVWYSTTTVADVSPTYNSGNMTYPGYTLTPPSIFNYTYIPQTYGIAPAVANAATNPLTLSTFGSDIPNSFTAIPFYKEFSTQQYKVGTMWGLTFTKEPALPSSIQTGDAPYYGPAGPYGWYNHSGVCQLITPAALPLLYDSPVIYWNTKVEFNVLDQTYDPATDLSSFGNYTGISGEFQDTLLYLYNNGTQSTLDVADVSTTRTDPTTLVTQTYWSWGAEQQANYIAADDQSGYNYLSYIHSVPVQTSNLYVAHTRAYDPIPQFRSGIRFIGKNYTDFGSPSLGGIAQEISTLAGYRPILDGTPYLASPSLYNSTISTNTAIRVNSNVGNYFSTEYANALITFDRTFSTTTTFGQQVGFSGIPQTYRGYADAISSYGSYYSTVTSNYAFYTGILSSATGQLNEYITSNYAGILPPSALNRSQYTAAIPFQLMFSTYLTAQQAPLIDEWGLGWYLGFKKADTYPPRVSVASDTFIAIIQNYIYLRLNPAYNINALAVSGKETLSDTRESAGQEAKYFSKILLNNFGSFSQAAVQLQKTFRPVVGQMETLQCQLVDKNGNQLVNADCEYDMTLNFTEVWQTPKDTASLQSSTADLDVYKG